MEKETEYLIKAVEEADCSIVVMQYTKNSSISRTKVVYISKNTEKLGLNMNAIRNGVRLPKDYIHPEDRPDFLDAVSVSQEVKNGFSNTVRVVGDDGTVHYVDVKAIYIDVDEKNYEVEYILREKSVNQVAAEVGSEEGEGSLSEEDEKNSKLEAFYQLMQESTGGGSHILADKESVSLFHIVSDVTGLYSMVVDLAGKPIIEPVGPSTHMGQFYDMTDRPFYKDLYEGIVSAFGGGETKYYSEMDDGNPDSRIAAVPIYEDGRFVATWILCAYDKTEKECLKRVLSEMPKTSEQIAKALHRICISDRFADWKGEEKKDITFEMRAKDILIELLTTASGSGEMDWNSVWEQAGKLLDLDYVVFYKEKEGKSDLYEVAGYWSSFGRSEEDILRLGWNRDAFSEEERIEIREEGFVVDHNSMTNRIRVGVFNGIARAVIIRPVMMDGVHVGRLVFFETGKERVWTEAELSFTVKLARILEKSMKTEKREGKMQHFTDSLTHILNEFNVGILVKSRVTGKVIFANDSLNHRLGYDFTGMDSARLVPDLRDAREGMSVSGSSTMGRWRRYINELGGIFDVSEVEMEWADGEPAAVLILRMAQE